MTQDDIAEEQSAAQAQYDAAKAEWARTGMCPICFTQAHDGPHLALLSVAERPIQRRDSQLAAAVRASTEVLDRYRMEGAA